MPGADDDAVSFDDELSPYRTAVARGQRGELRSGDLGSAVLAPLVRTSVGLCLLLERRPEGTNRFAGHLSFPGGRIEPQDASPLAAALRESEEEIGFGAADVDVLGHLLHTEDPRGRPVDAFVGVLGLGSIPDEAASPGEVDEMILVPVADLRAVALQPDPDALPPHLYRVASHETRRHRVYDRVVHYWMLKQAGGTRTATLWGFTAGLSALLLERAFDWSAAREPRLVEAWDDMLP